MSKSPALHTQRPILLAGIRIIEDEGCRSTKEFREEMCTRHRTWRQRFVDGPVWSPKPATYQEMGTMGIPVAYELPRL